MADPAELVQVELIGATANDEATFDSLVRQGHPASVTFVDSDGKVIGSFYVQFNRPGDSDFPLGQERQWW